MKNLVSLGMMALLIAATSCKDAQKETQTTEPEEKSLEEKIDSKDCYEHESISPDTALLWFNSWSYAAGGVIGGEFPDSPEFVFSKDNIDKIEPELKTNKGALIYYILKDPVTSASTDEEKIPSLAMIRTKDCDPFYGDCGDYCVLVSWRDTGKQEFLTQKELDDGILVNYITNWTTYLNSIDEAVIKVEGYYYPWTLIDFLLGKSSPIVKQQGIVIKYGVRTLGPGEIQEFEEEPYTEPYIIPVLCNVIFPLGEGQSTEEAFQVHAELVGDNGFDFAKPCPTYCD